MILRLLASFIKKKKRGQQQVKVWLFFNKEELKYRSSRILVVRTTLWSRGQHANFSNHCYSSSPILEILEHIVLSSINIYSILFGKNKSLILLGKKKKKKKDTQGKNLNPLTPFKQLLNGNSTNITKINFSILKTTSVYIWNQTERNLPLSVGTASCSMEKGPKLNKNIVLSKCSCYY